MKLKQAIKIARKKGFEWVLVTYDGAIMAVNGTPALTTHVCKGTPVPESWSFFGDGKFNCLGQYTGNKHWADTLRCTVEDSEVEVETKTKNFNSFEDYRDELGRDEHIAEVSQAINCILANAARRATNTERTESKEG